ncbi:hypothetical protein [Crateriforma conspicua]|uniref:hypothetical protein n=1 Tax=Crateriforma conspicua TaxID=2527996 RepID=UPI0011B5AE33|nr:hypothetical protein [Crateriforma conspicua]
MSPISLYLHPIEPKPAPGEPGRFCDQLAAVTVAIYLGKKRGTSAKDEWRDARNLTIPHAADTSEVPG